MKLKSPTNTPVHVALLSGDAIRIGPEGCDVPVIFRQQAFANGCIPADMAPEDMQQKVAEPTQKDNATLLRDVLTAMRDEGCGLTGAGLPFRNTVSARAGWNVSPIELADAWNSLEPR